MISGHKFEAGIRFKKQIFGKVENKSHWELLQRMILILINLQKYYVKKEGKK